MEDNKTLKKDLEVFDINSAFGDNGEPRNKTQDEMIQNLGESAVTTSIEETKFTGKHINKMSTDWLDVINGVVKSGLYSSANKFLLEAVAEKLLSEGFILESDPYIKVILAHKLKAKK